MCFELVTAADVQLMQGLAQEEALDE
jgi:hypothetical protein